jgi:uncharacterized protein YceK
MKKVILIVFAIILLAGCGVKTELDSASPTYPRNYPVY